MAEPRSRFDQMNDHLVECIALIRDAKATDPYVDDFPSARIENIEERRRLLIAIRKHLHTVIKLTIAVTP